ncbi:MAG TPA: hypothetical protein VF503_10730 [Sphingobium sp.]|uniref:hypothetical protein n=1 Tax=Sphingobium sp. TaxID=1912891 RepID=UPI002ED26106
MPKFKMVALTNPVRGRDDEFNDWYQNIHLPEIVAYKGMVSAQRFKVAVPLQEPGGTSFGYLAIYDIDTDDVGALLQRFGGDSAAGKNTTSDAADSASSYTVIFNEFGAPVTHEQAVAKLGER